MPQALEPLFNSRMQHQKTGSQRPQQALVSRASQNVDGQVSQVDRQMPGRLRGIDEKQDSGAAGDFTDSAVCRSVSAIQ